MDQIWMAYATAPAWAQELLIVVVPAAVALAIYGVLGGTRPTLWQRLVFRGNDYVRLFEHEQAAEHDAACRREQALLDAVLAQDRKRSPAPWRRGRGPTI